MKDRTTRKIFSLFMIMTLAILTASACSKTDTSDTKKADSSTPTAEAGDNSQTTVTPSENEPTSTPEAGNNGNDTNKDQRPGRNGQGNSGYTEPSSDALLPSALDTDNLFSKRDLNQSPDLSDATVLTVSDGGTLQITEAGIYRITGTASDAQIRVDAGLQDKVQIVLDGVTITNTDRPAICILSADKCFITTTGTNSLSVTGAFAADGDSTPDAVIYSKQDLVLNGTGTLTITSSKGNGITGKDDLVVTGGTYRINSSLDSIEAHDSIAICGGTFEIKSSKDGLHSEDDEDSNVGWIYISGGTFNINAKSDGIQSTTFIRIDGCDLTITGSEGIEATCVVINDGTIDITASDDGINASTKSKTYGTPSVTFNGGNTKIVVGQGDTDAVDVNGNLTVNGGTIDVTAQMSSFDYDGTATYTGGTIIVNGTQVDSIPEPTMMGGPGGGPGGFRGGNSPGGDFQGGNFPGGDFPGRGNRGDSDNNNSNDPV